MAANAKARAEEVLGQLQERAKALLEAQDGMAQAVRTMVEENNLTPAEIRKRLDDLLGRMKAKEVWEQIRSHEKVVALNDYRGGVEKRIEQVVDGLLQRVPVATKADLQGIGDQLRAINERVGELAGKLRGGKGRKSAEPANSDEAPAAE